MSIPLVFIHQQPRDSWYLPYVLYQARAFNPTSQLIVIGTGEFDCKGLGRFVEMGAYLADARRFAAEYQHLSTNLPPYEVFCFERWFILYAWMEKEGVETCFYVDSDMLIYADVTQDTANYQGAELTYLGGGPLCGFISRAALGRFCEFLLWFYRDPESLQKARGYFEAVQQRGVAGGVSDMTLFEWFRLQEAEVQDATAQSTEVQSPFIDITQVVQGARYDLNINQTEGFKLRRKGDIKRVSFRKNQPFATDATTQAPIRFKSLHFQGSAKLLIPQFVRPRGPQYQVFRLLLHTSPNHVYRAIRFRASLWRANLNTRLKRA